MDSVTKVASDDLMVKGLGIIVKYMIPIGMILTFFVSLAKSGIRMSHEAETKETHTETHLIQSKSRIEGFGWEGKFTHDYAIIETGEKLPLDEGVYDKLEIESDKLTGLKIRTNGLGKKSIADLNNAATAAGKIKEEREATAAKEKAR